MVIGDLGSNGHRAVLPVGLAHAFVSGFVAIHVQSMEAKTVREKLRKTWDVTSDLAQVSIYHTIRPCPSKYLSYHQTLPK